LTGLLLATLLNLSPGIQLADNVESRNVALSEARLPLLFVSDDDGPRPSLDAMTREQLAVELRRLDETKPSIVGPIILLSVGGAVAIPGLYLVLTNVGYLGTTSTAVRIATFIVLGVGAVMITVGAILALVGGIKLATRLGERGRHAQDTDEVRKKIDALDQAAPPPPPPPPGPDMLPPPPPPPPPQANLVVPGGMQTVMTF